MRLFLAATFPEDVLRDIGARVAHLRTRLPPASWVRDDAHHLTLAFLGEQDAAMVERLCHELGVQLGNQPLFEARVRACGFFPNSRNARVAWLGVEPEHALVTLASNVREAVERTGVTLDGAAFKPHLTLCRMREQWPPACTEMFLSAFRSYESPAFPIDRVTLFSSRLDPKGAIHSALCTVKLQG